LESRHLVRNMQQVLTARVPIIKFEMIDSGLAFDVCWEVPSGPEGAQVVKQLLRDWPALKPLALVLKVRGGVGRLSAGFAEHHGCRRDGAWVEGGGGGFVAGAEATARVCEGGGEGLGGAQQS
jgi:hypothetical protein